MDMSIGDKVREASRFAGYWGSEPPPQTVYRDLHDLDDNAIIDPHILVDKAIVVLDTPEQFPELFDALPDAARRMEDQIAIVQRRASDHSRAAEALGVGVLHFVRLYSFLYHTDATEILIQDIRPRVTDITTKLGLAAVIAAPEYEQLVPMSLSFITDMNDLKDLGYASPRDVAFRVHGHNMLQGLGGSFIPVPLESPDIGSAG
jgi:hypothetical protein